MKVFAFIMSALLMVGGVYCMAMPDVTYLSIAWVIGVLIVVEGISVLVGYPAAKRAGTGNGWDLATGIISLIAGCALIGSNALQLVTDVIILYIISAWIILRGILRIVEAFQLRSIATNTGATMVSRNWGVLLVMGILMIVLGILTFAHPAALAIAVGIYIGVVVFFCGIDLFIIALAM